MNRNTIMHERIVKMESEGRIKNDTVAVGRFTIVTITDERAHIGVGIARRSFSDSPKQDIGVKIARGRAEKAFWANLHNRNIRHNFMG